MTMPAAKSNAIRIAGYFASGMRFDVGMLTLIGTIWLAISYKIVKLIKKVEPFYKRLISHPMGEALYLRSIFNLYQREFVDI
jgi:hypothetical protein